MGTHRFAARIYRVGMNYCVDVPAEVSATLGRGKYIEVRGEASGQAFRTRLTPRGGGRHRLFLNGSVRAAAGVGEGDEVTVELAPDESRPEPELPTDLVAALDRLDGGVQAFAALTAAQRRGMVEFVERARRPETRERYIERVVEVVSERTGLS